MHRNRNPCNSFLMVKMASGMNHGRVRLETTNDDDVAQHGGHPANTESCSLGYICYSPALVGPYWEKLCPLSRVRPEAASRQRAQFFPIRTDQGR